jgi:chromosomal replication initiator protein
MRVAKEPGTRYNPFFLYGGTGLGKTHLMHAIGNAIFADSPSSRIIYLTAEQFMNELVADIQQGDMANFRRRYRQMDVLLMDDVQFLQRGERTQEEFFHTFNALYDAGRQIVLTSDRPPKEMPGLEERLVSRFEWGVAADIKPPDLETRIAILNTKAREDGLQLDEDVIRFIAESCTASVRELEGAVIKLLAYSSLTHQDITPDMARSALAGMLGRSSKQVPFTTERIKEVVSRHWNVKSAALASKRRTKDITTPRQVAMYLIKELMDLPLVSIGAAFGGRDHSTVIHSVRKIETALDSDAELRGQIERVRSELLRGP